MIVEAAGADHEQGLLALFERCASPCFCRYWHFAGNKNEWLDRCANRPEENASELAAALRACDPSASGLVARDAETGAVVGWMKLSRRASVPKLRALPVYRTLALGPEETTWSIGCFLVDPGRRRSGVARALVLEAPRFARALGARAIEAYPRRSSEPLHDEEAWHGPERLFVELGWTCVHDVAPYPVYRNVLSS